MKTAYHAYKAMFIHLVYTLEERNSTWGSLLTETGVLTRATGLTVAGVQCTMVQGGGGSKPSAHILNTARSRKGKLRMARDFTL